MNKSALSCSEDDLGCLIRFQLPTLLSPHVGAQRILHISSVFSLAWECFHEVGKLAKDRQTDSLSNPG